MKVHPLKTCIKNSRHTQPLSFRNLIHLQPIHIHYIVCVSFFCVSLSLPIFIREVNDLQFEMESWERKKSTNSLTQFSLIYEQIFNTQKSENIFLNFSSNVSPFFSTFHVQKDNKKKVE